MYIPRAMEQSLLDAGKHFPVVMLTGARQVGKTTVMRHADANRAYVSLDIPAIRDLASSDPALFLERYQPPLMIDEIQHAPALLPHIKALVDARRENGLFWLTGSQQFPMMRGVTESLAGRVAVLELMGLSSREEDGRPSHPFIPEAIAAPTSTSATMDLPKLYRRIWRGAFPALAADPGMDSNLFFASYVATYLERDVRMLGNIGDLQRFHRFLRAAAARTGQLLNHSDLARDSDISVPTAKSYLAVLVASGLVYLLEPYFNNLTKRLTRTPKLYFLDTGLCSHLTGWLTPETLEAGAMSGAIFETWCVAELLKSYRNIGRSAPFFFYRDFDQVEIDLLIESDGKLHPVEFKKTASPKAHDVRHFNALGKLGKPIGHGALVCMAHERRPLSRECDIVPAGSL